MDLDQITLPTGPSENAKMTRKINENKQHLRRDKMQEDIAKIIYDAMSWAAKSGPKPGGTVPDWTEGGNSNAQDHARSAANKISSLYEPEHKI